MYAAFVANNSIPLEAEGGGDCYPFADALGVTKSNLPQCRYPDNEDGICAFVFEDANDGFLEPSECEGRRYSMQTFDTEGNVPDNASITHRGPCGVCSSAQDLSSRMKLRDKMSKIGTLCGTKYYVNGFSLTQCFVETAGFTRGCAELWGYYTVAVAELCGSQCQGDHGPANGDPPECTLNECFQCFEQFNFAFDRVAGRSLPNSGITEEEQVGRNCSEFYPIMHDPCPGQKAPPTSPTPSPNTSGGTYQWGTTAALVVVSVMMGWQM
jgi:hypothetical protein